MRVPWTAAAWDWVPAAALLAYGQWELWTAESARLTGPRPVVALALTVASGGLVVRRRRPITALAIVLTAVFVPVAAGTYAELRSLVYCLVITIYACGRYAKRPFAYAVLPVTMLAVLWAASADPTETVAGTWTWSLNAIWIFGIGAWLRQKAELVERARREGEERTRAASAEERVQIARELHDVLAHSLSVMVVQAEAADEILDADAEAARVALSHVQDAGRAALTDTRRLLGLLRDPTAEAPAAPLPGIEEVPALVERFRAAGLPVELEMAAVHYANDGSGRAAYRVVQEALTNTLRHAGLVRTCVRITPATRDLLVEVLDDGPAVTSSVAGGHGLIGMRERVESCGGALAVGPRPTGGFRIGARIPLDVPGAGSVPA